MKDYGEARQQLRYAVSDAYCLWEIFVGNVHECGQTIEGLCDRIMNGEYAEDIVNEFI